MNTNFDPFPVISTERLILRALTLTDSGELFKLRSDEQVNRYLDRPPTTTIEQAEAFIHKIAQVVQNRDGIYWVISRKDEPSLIGTICYWNFNVDKASADIGYELMPKYQRQGLMTEALQAVIDYGFDNMRLKMIIALTHPDNAVSAKLLKRTGFVLDERYGFVSEDNAEGQVVYIFSNSN
ncbi:GNAT family N-acetyltransferase [Mucilaginibacter boryungensis]|uniref:GNAT family N-acetyltransferase n=1 Tax=Mucilaginibacter boryungensis TaxID=768480 RepID=A0ABR9XI41_9SPHI|nr:GNAT family N-acetyltransferase [Mucilaginibacter boryungensis]MBE9667049.1 GNAT family N-acetyltransferase [Mucilaginibacter boryungensis]